MSEFEQLEKRLQRQPLRKVPAVWREDILSAARSAQDSSRVARVTRHGFRSALNQQLATLLWPHPRAWAGLAATWVLIGGLNLAYREEALPASAGRIAPPTPQLREMLRAQEQLLAELVEEIPLVHRPKIVPPRPHSYYRNEFLNA